jgi:hypothetical protein
MTDIHQEAIERFWADIAPWEKAYIHSGLSFVAVRHNGQLHMVHGRLFLRPSPLSVQSTPFESKSVSAGYFPLSGLGLTPRVLVDKIVAAEPINTPLGPLLLPLGCDARPSAHLLPYHPEGLGSGSKLAVLMITGAQRYGYVRQPQLDWELKAASLPFDALGELLAAYSLGPYKGDFAHLEVVATSVAAVDFNSQVQGITAKPAMFLANALEKSDCHLGYRVLLHGQVMERGTIDGNDLGWEPGEHYARGTGTLTIPAGAALQCFATYSGMAHHQGWVVDPTLSQNPRRAALEEFDDKLTVLRDFLLEELKPRREARNFEIGVTWLLWMLGFNVVHVGAAPRLSDATDLLATTPKGHMLLVECTTGQLKAESKLAKLVERAQTIRKRLDASGNHHIRLLPVIATALGREEVRADLDQAQQLGVVVATREDLQSGLNRTIVQQNPDLLLAQAEESLRSHQEQLDLK